MAEYEKLKTEDAEHEAEIKALDNAIDYHTKDNRDKRKGLQERRNVIARKLGFIKRSADNAHRAMQQLYGNAEQNLSLAKHAETWEWKEAKASTEPSAPIPDTEVSHILA